MKAARTPRMRQDNACSRIESYKRAGGRSPSPEQRVTQAGILSNVGMVSRALERNAHDHCRPTPQHFEGSQRTR